MTFLPCLSPKARLREMLLQAEADARLHPRQPPAEAPRWSHQEPSEGWMTMEDEVRYRRILAKLHYGEPTEIPEYEVLLTDREREHLDSYLLKKMTQGLGASTRGGAPFNQRHRG